MFHTSTGKLVVHVKSEKRRSKLSGYVEHANCLVHTNCLRPLCFTRCQKPVRNGPLWQNNCEGDKKGVRKVGTEWKTARTNVFHSSACVSLPNARLSGMMHGGSSSARRQRRLKKKKKVGKATMSLQQGWWSKTSTPCDVSMSVERCSFFNYLQNKGNKINVFPAIFTDCRATQRKTKWIQEGRKIL